MKRILDKLHLSPVSRKTPAAPPAAFRLPQELLEQTFAFLDAVSLERAARSCKMFWRAAELPRRYLCAQRGVVALPSGVTLWGAAARAITRAEVAWGQGLPKPKRRIVLPATLGQTVNIAFTAGHLIIAAEHGVVVRRLRGGATQQRHYPVQAMAAVPQSGHFLIANDLALRCEPIAAGAQQTQRTLPEPCKKLFVNAAGTLAVTTHADGARVWELPSLHPWVYRPENRSEILGFGADGRSLLRYNGAQVVAETLDGAALWQAIIRGRGHRATICQTRVLLDDVGEVSTFDLQGQAQTTWLAPGNAGLFEAGPHADYAIYSGRRWVGQEASEKPATHIVNLTNGGVIGPFTVHPSEAKACAVSTLGAWIAVAEADSCTLWHLQPTRASLRQAPHYLGAGAVTGVPRRRLRDMSLTELTEYLAG